MQTYGSKHSKKYGKACGKAPEQIERQLELLHDGSGLGHCAQVAREEHFRLCQTRNGKAMAWRGKGASLTIHARWHARYP